MSKFNTTVKEPKTLTTNLAGGDAYKQSNELELVSTLLTSFVNDQFYKSTESTLEDLRKVLKKVNPVFAAKAAIYARDKFGMRSISHAVAGELSSYLQGSESAKSFYDKVVVRVDDMTEILSYYLLHKTNRDNPKFPNALKKGFAKAFDKFDDYQLAKYSSKNKDIKLVDLVNLVHPVPTDRNKIALESLVKGDLKNTETWEAKLSKAGQVAENAEDLSTLKADAWTELIDSRKIGYFALLRNLRNIITQAPRSLDAACKLLTDEKMIVKSRVLPFRFATAYEEISKVGNSNEVRKVLVALSDALEISVANVPKFDGETLVVMDVSGSMSGKPSEIASLFGAVLAKANNCDVMTFSTNSQYKSYNPLDSVMTIRNGFKYSGGGTNFRSIFVNANRKYDRIIILSDMQGWIGGTTPRVEFNAYKTKYDANPFIYSWDLNNYGTLQFPEKNVFALAGFSEKVFDVMKLMEADKKTIFDDINTIEL